MKKEGHQPDRSRSQERESMLSELVKVLVHNKKWWLLPIIVMLLLVALLFILGGTAAEPFIYPVS